MLPLLFEVWQSTSFTIFLSLSQRGLLDNEMVHMPRGSIVATPSTLDENNSDKVIGVSHNIATKRRRLTYDAAKKIHANSNLTEPEVQCATATRMWNTLVANSVIKFEKSSNNYQRSVSVLYRG